MMSKKGGEDTTGTTPLTQADISELVKAVAVGLIKKDTLKDPSGPAEAEGSKSRGKSCPTCKLVITSFRPTKSHASGVSHMLC